MYRYPLVIILVFASLNCSAQIIQPNRYEVELKPYDQYFYVISAEENGLVMIRPTKETNKQGDVQWEMIKLDTALNEEWKELIFVDSQFHLTGYDYHENSIFILFNNGPYTKDDLTLLKFDLEEKNPVFYTVSKDFAIELTAYEMVGDYAIFGGYVNYKTTVFLYHLKDEKMIVLPGFYLDRSELIQVEVDDEREIFRVLSTIRTIDKRNTISIKTFNKDGTLLLNTTIKPDQGYNLIYGRSTSIINDAHYIAGTYSKVRSARKGKESYSMGIFIAKLEANGDQSINYYNYADLENFFNYMKAKRRERIKRRIERRRIKGKRIKFNYRLLIHDIIERKNGNYIMLGEAYYPTYSNRSDNWGGPYYPSPYHSNIFSGYRYTHAVVIEFDKTGELLWDNSFEINDVTSYNLEKYVNVDFKNNSIVLLYSYENVIRTKLIEGDEVVEGKSFNDLALKFENDIVQNTDNEVGGLKQWYDDKFYAYGIQNIRNEKEGDVKLKREVFFINKINYQ